MKNFLILLLLTIAISAQAQVTKKQLQGKWKSVNASKKGCDDIVNFIEGGMYTISNNCFGSKDSADIDEHGEWVLNGRVLSLILRKFENEYNLKGRTNQVNCSVESIKDGKLTLVFKINGTDVREVYQKVK